MQERLQPPLRAGERQAGLARSGRARLPHNPPSRTRAGAGVGQGLVPDRANTWGPAPVSCKVRPHRGNPLCSGHGPHRDGQEAGGKQGHDQHYPGSRAGAGGRGLGHRVLALAALRAALGCTHVRHVSIETPGRSGHAGRGWPSCAAGGDHPRSPRPRAVEDPGAADPMLLVTTRKSAISDGTFTQCLRSWRRSASEPNLLGSGWPSRGDFRAGAGVPPQAFILAARIRWAGSRRSIALHWRSFSSAPA